MSALEHEFHAPEIAESGPTTLDLEELAAVGVRDRGQPCYGVCRAAIDDLISLAALLHIMAREPSGDQGSVRSGSAMCMMFGASGSGNEITGSICRSAAGLLRFRVRISTHGMERSHRLCLPCANNRVRRLHRQEVGGESPPR